MPVTVSAYWRMEAELGGVGFGDGVAADDGDGGGGA